MPMHGPQSIFTDDFIEQRERDRFDGPPTAEDRLVGALLQVIRRTNVTASPPAHIKPIIWSEPIDQSGQTTLAAAVSAYQTVCTYTVPDGRNARISAYGVNVQDAAYTYNGSILWRFTVNGNALGNGMSDWAQQRGSVVNQRPTFIRLKERDTIRFQVRRAVLAGAPQVVEMSFTGWDWLLRNSYEGTAASVTAF